MNGADRHREPEPLPLRAWITSAPRWDPIEPRACPEAESIAAFAEGLAPANERGEIERHLVDCAVCRAAVAEVIRTSEREPLVMPRRTIAHAPRFALWIAAAAVLIGMGIAIWFAWQGDDPADHEAGARTAQALSARAAELSARHRDLLGDLRLLDEAELQATPSAVVRSTGEMSLLQPRGLVPDLRPELCIARSGSASTLAFELTDEAGSPIETASFAPAPGTDRILRIAWPFATPLAYARAYLLHVAVAEAPQSVRASTAFRVEYETAALRFESAREILAREASPAERAALLVHLALRRGYRWFAFRAAEDWNAAAPEDEFAQTTLAHAARAIGLPRRSKGP